MHVQIKAYKVGDRPYPSVAAESSEAFVEVQHVDVEMSLEIHAEN